VTEERARANLPLESFFDLVFVLAFTQVTGYFSHHLSWVGVLQGSAMLVALWWTWVTYAWLTDTIAAHEDLKARVVILTATAGMLIVSLAVPEAFSGGGVLFGTAYFIVRLLHVALYLVASDQPSTRKAIIRLAPGLIGGPLLILIGAFFEGSVRIVLWFAGLALDYGMPLVRGVKGLDIHPGHFVERHQLVIILALGESIIAIGTTVRDLRADGVVAAIVAMVLCAALWWMYFDETAQAFGRRLAELHGHERARVARDAYSYIHLLMVAGIIFLALGIELTLPNSWSPLGTIPAFALCGGVALYLAGLNAYHLRVIGTLRPIRVAAMVLAVVVFPVARSMPALVMLGLLAALLIAVISLEASAFKVWRREIPAPG
jgi:low temperature requirement protein LtrA